MCQPVANGPARQPARRAWTREELNALIRAAVDDAVKRRLADYIRREVKAEIARQVRR